MKIGCLQFAPQVGDVDNNLNRADAIITKANPEDLDLLVLPELAVTGYNFQSLRDISPFLEPTAAGVTSLWARTTALKHNCIVIAGYPETADVRATWPTSPEYYNASIIVNGDGDTIGHYRKTHLYYTDETWALEGSGFYQGRFPGIDSKVAMGICMDIKFEAPWHAFEFAFHVLDTGAKLVILSMAWLTTEDLGLYSSKSSEPDLDTLTYWLTRLEPLIRAEGDEEIIIVFANRTGIEDNAVYAGTSAVIGIQAGEVSVYGVLSRGAKELLVVDTDATPYAKLVYRPGEGERSVDTSGGKPQVPSNEKTNREDSSDASKGSPNGPEKPGSAADPNTETSEPLIKSDHRSISQADDRISPASPRYSWGPSPIDPFARNRSPSSDIRGTYKERPVSPHGTHSRPYDDHKEPVERTVPRSAGPESSSGFPTLVSKFNDPATTGETFIDQPHLKKSRNASRNRSHDSQSLSSDGQRKERMSISTSRREEQDTKVMPRKTAPDSCQRSSSPDLEKLGADLMVFEGGSANKSQRDSLVCHIDEEDFAVFWAKLKDSAEKKSSRQDGRAGRSRSRNNKTGESLKKSNGRSRSRNKISAEPPTHPHETNGATPTRPASRGRHRSNSNATPKSMSKKVSHGHMTSSEALPLGLVEARGRVTQSTHHARHQGESLSEKLAPLSSDRHQRDHAQATRKQVNHGNAALTTDREVPLPIRTAKHPQKGSRSTSTKGAIPSPEATRSSPSIRASPTVAETKASARKVIPERLPPTPKPMSLPPDYDVSNNHQSMPVPPKKQQHVIAVKCLDQTAEVRKGRPRSAVW